MAEFEETTLKVVDKVRVGIGLQFRRLIVGTEGVLDILDGILEVENEGQSRWRGGCGLLGVPGRATLKMSENSVYF